MATTVDTSIYSQNKAAPYNPLTTLGQVSTIGNQLQQNQLLRTQNQSAQVGLAMQQFDNLQKFLAPLAADDNLTDEKVMNAGARAINELNLPPAMVASELGNLPADPAGRQKAFAMHMIRIQNAADQMASVYGQNQAINNGAQTVLGVRQSPLMGGGFEQTGAVNNMLTPGENASPRSAVNPQTGATYTVPLSSVVTPQGYAKESQEPSPRPQGIVTNKAGSEPEFDQIGQELENSAAAQAQNKTPNVMPKPNTALPTGAMQTSLGTGEVEDKEQQAKMGINLQNSADSVNDRKGLLNELGGIVKSGDVNFGPGSPEWKKILSGVQRVYGGSSEDVAKYDTFNKLATQLAQRQFQTLGGTGTDAKLSSAMDVSPNTELSNLSNERIIGLLKGNEDAIKVKNDEWQKWKADNGPGSYAQFSSQFNKSYDPRIFQAQYLPKNEVHKMLDTMSDSELDKYKQDYNAALQKGWIQGNK